MIRKLELLAAQFNCVLWIRNEEYNQQLYVSNTYQQLFNHSCLSLYTDSTVWDRLFNMDEDADFLKDLKKKRVLINPNYTAVYNIKIKGRKKRWFMDRSFHLPVSLTLQKIIVGCALPLENEDDIHLNQDKYSDKLDYYLTQFYQILTQPHDTTYLNNPNNESNTTCLNKLTLREKQIFKLFLQGKTILQVADAIYLSPRTVESYLTNLKKKLSCGSKSELIMKAIENGWLLVNL